jgi:organic hydroperoxide reductase OsmC/OhrA
MAEHRAHIRWAYTGGEFAKGRYSREHSWTFDGGVTVPASPSPSIVPAPFSNPASVDPEEAYVAAIASCHMLSFLYVASRAGIEVLRYDDEAVGHMTRNERGALWVSSVELRPRVVYAPGTAPSAEREAELHHRAHDECFIANSVRTDIRVVGEAALDSRLSALGSS